MFANRYFAPRFFPTRHFPQGGVSLQGHDPIRTLTQRMSYLTLFYFPMRYDESLPLSTSEDNALSFAMNAPSVSTLLMNYEDELLHTIRADSHAD